MDADKPLVLKKVCTKCKVGKTLLQFYTDNRRFDGRQAHCKECFKKYKHKYYRKNTTVHKKRAEKNRMKSVYGIDPDTREMLWKAQNGKCAVCGKAETEFKNRLGVEHCHQTKRIRGLACFYCNVHIIGKVNLKYAPLLVKYLLKAYPEIREDIATFLKDLNK
jgi:hypothetical protein